MSTTTKQLAEAFIRWPLPKSVRSDECATVRQEGRIGTNLMTYVEAEKMFTDIVGPTLAENAALLIDCDAKRLRLAECRAENAALREALQNCAYAASGQNWQQIAWIVEGALYNPRKEAQP